MKLNKKTEQLGMSYGKANNILVRNIIWKFILQLNLNSCHHCKKEMTRENFTIEHIEPWLDSEDPVDLFFNDNLGEMHKITSSKNKSKVIFQGKGA
jgi:hypothetical protein